MRVNDPAQDCEQHPDRSRRVSTTHVARPDGTFTRACSVGPVLSMALAVAAFNARKEAEQ